MENFGKMVTAWENGKMPVLEILEQTGLKEATFYRRLREWRSSKNKQPLSESTPFDSGYFEANYTICRLDLQEFYQNLHIYYAILHYA